MTPEQSPVPDVGEVVDGGSDNAIYGKCEDCGHLWPVVYLPQPVNALTRLMKSKCPRGHQGKVFLGKEAQWREQTAALLARLAAVEAGEMGDA